MEIGPSGAGLPEPHASFLRQALERLREDPRLVGVAAGGSYLTGAMDQWSDLDLIVAAEPAAYAAVIADRPRIAASLGDLLAAFTGEHVGEPRVLICLYRSPLLHVDLKFVTVAAIAERVEDPAVLWERDGRLTAALRAGHPRFPEPDRQWIEDRFWVWVHYTATKIGRGELFEVQDALALLRGRVLGPLALKSRGARPAGVRRLETAAPDLAREMADTVASHDARDCARALAASAALYRKMRDAQPGACTPRLAAEAAALAFLDQIRSQWS